MAKQGKNGGCGTLLIICFIIGVVTTYWPLILVILGIALAIELIRKSKLKNSPLGNVDFDAMDGHQFEHFCAKALRANGFRNVKVTQGSGDHGIDVLASKDGNTYAIQCKCYSNNVGNKAVQEAYSGKGIYRADVAVVMTNRYFTKQAIEDARSLGVWLWDRNKLKNLIRLSDKNNLVENSVETEQNGKIIKEKIYMVRGVAIRMQLNEYNDISVLIVDAKDVIVLACIFFYLYIEFRDKYKDKYSCEISTVYNGKTVNCDNEYIYGYNWDGTISRTTPDWLEKARNDLIDIGTENYMDVVSGVEDALCDFFSENREDKNVKSEKEEIEKRIEIDEGKIRMTCVKISNQFSCFGIKIEILEINSDSDNIIFYIRQEQGVRVKTIMSYKPDISLAIGAECEMKLISEKGYIGIFVPAKYFIKTS